MRIYYDLHIHSALSPCADDDMTPCNIVHMAHIKGLDAIAVTDHNCAKNVRAAIKVGEQVGVTVIAGMEITTAEEVHVLAYFPTADAAEKADAVIRGTLPPMKNRADIFGRQLILDENDALIGEDDALLMSASSLSIDEVFSLVRGLGGATVPAHIDRTSFSILSNLGFIPDSLGVGTVEISAAADLSRILESHPELQKHQILTSSDAHQLGAISEPIHAIEILHNKPCEIISKFI